MSASRPLCLLTGATGFIGQRIKDLLIRHRYNLRILARKPVFNSGQIEHFCGELADVSACHKAMKQVNIVIHTAGEKKTPALFWPVNVRGTENLLSAANTAGIKRFVHVSSVGVIGADPFRGRVFDEGTPCIPHNQYERSKWEAERLVIQAGNAGLPVAILRPANVFGDCDPEKHLLRLAQSVLDGQFIYLGGRDVICNYVFVEDIASACLTLAEHPNAVNRVYHISDSCTLGELVNAMSDELCVARPRHEMPGSLAGLFRTVLRVMIQLPGLSQSSVMARLVSLNNQASFSTSRLTDELGFKFPVGWREGVKRMIAWYRSQGEL